MLVGTGKSSAGRRFRLPSAPLDALLPSPAKPSHRSYLPPVPPPTPQDLSLPVPERLARALSSAGPSITLAAACEGAAFALGGALTSMPAVRNFSLAAAAAVVLDFVLQVGGARGVQRGLRQVCGLV